MPSTIQENNTPRHTDEMQDIITAVPSWLLRWGITLFFAVLILIISLAALIKYPDIVKTRLKIQSPNSPKPVVARVAGKLVKLLVTENELVTQNQPLAFMESTGNHAQVMQLTKSLIAIQNEAANNKPVNGKLLINANSASLGELQAAYQAFYQDLINYQSAIDNGFYLKKKTFLEKDLADINLQTGQLQQGKIIQQRNFKLAADEYEMHKKLATEKVETASELRQQEAKFLAQKSPLVQTESALVTANNNYTGKQKEILELDNQISEQKAKFRQSLNSLISQAEDWENKYILRASQAGKVAYAGIIQQNQVLNAGQEVFYINPGNEAFFGEMTIPQDNMGKVKEGQQVLIKLRSYPFEEYGMIKGKINYIADVPYKDSVFISKVDFKVDKPANIKRAIHLKQGMMADAEIVTEDATIFQRITNSVFKIMVNK
ncbi:HlyD family secretion protein [Mucilaginibacter dorajii]|uniref:HlyD family efflux transporter periplasmic adaptor subunit n=1 Tax=Mucilaginibacter dorajii TaxID=692994 RepID=A0ABP7Q7W6_9SPHI|nr:HlyD family secretion protein [Mucilaginibacter dorajii]MCS3737552.1 HlyD family secretion protein [Mucilaginibacter dorajii]